MQIGISSEKVLVKRHRDSDSNSEDVYKIKLINFDYLLNNKYYRNTFYPISTIPNCRKIIYRYISIMSNKTNKNGYILIFYSKRIQINLFFNYRTSVNFS